MKKVIVFGATGNIGQNLFEYIFEEKINTQYDFVAVGRNFDKFNFNVDKEIIDITNINNFDKLKKYGDIYAVIHLAAMLQTSTINSKLEDFIKVNVNGTNNILDFAVKQKCQKFIYTQSVQDILPFVKDGDVIPEIPSDKIIANSEFSNYILTKELGRKLIEDYKRRYAFNAYIFRIPLIYSANSSQYYYRNNVKVLRPFWQFIQNAQDNQPIEIWGDEYKGKEMVYAKDAAQMLLCALKEDSEEGFYNVGTGKAVSMIELITTIIKVYNSKSKIVFKRDKPTTPAYIMDIDKAKEKLHYMPKYDCERIIKEIKEKNYNG